MMYGDELVTRLNTLMKNAERRIWIAVPFVGTWNNVKRIIGTKWITDPNIEVRLLIDINNESHIKADTIKQFKKLAEIRSLTGLHAKIYIIDDRVILTSANLTGTAFSKRYEFGIELDLKKEKNIETIFNKWWEEAYVVDSNWLPKKRESKTKIEKDEYDTKGLVNLWNLPEPFPKVRMSKKYIKYVKAYNHFKGIYLQNVKRVWSNVPIYHEIDSFLNFLYHEHSSKPSKIYKKRKYRALTNKQRIHELKKYHEQFRKWLKKSDWESAEGRLDRIKTIQELLSPKKIQKLTRSKIETVISKIHSTNSLPINRFKFLNGNNNPTKKIIESWNYLLHRKDLPIEERMEFCNKNLVFFGKSAIQELVSNYYPDKYPVINTNSNCGMKFFGYDVPL